jgi:hypothetical protein
VHHSVGAKSPRISWQFLLPFVPALLVTLLASSAHAADQTILGREIVLKNPDTPERRSIRIRAKENASADTIVGDPTVSGATLVLTVDGANRSRETFRLPQGTAFSGDPFWSGDAVNGYRYLDARGANGPIKFVRIVKTDGGTFKIKIRGKGKRRALNVTPPDAGTESCAFLKIGDGDSYSIGFGALDGEIGNIGGVRYTHRQPAGEQSCLPGLACAPGTCEAGQPCSLDTDCVSDICELGFCGCDGNGWLVQITATTSHTLRSWPGGGESLGDSYCGVTVSYPSGNISDLSGDTWTLGFPSGFSGCFVMPGQPECNTDLAVARILDNGRPYCSNSSEVFSSGPSSAHATVSCYP